MRDMKRQCRIFRIFAEHNTSVRITDDISLLNWIPHFAMQFLNKMRRRQSMAQFGEEELISFVKCIIQESWWVIMIEQEQFHASSRR